jgi:hypothetical protein
MSQTSPLPGPPPLRSSDNVLEHYADGVVGVNFANGNLNITFVTIRADHSKDPAPQYRQATFRLVLPLAGALELQNIIGAMIAKLQAQQA